MKLNNRIGKYELGRTLGEGNFAKVKYAIDVETRRSYAVKILDKEMVFHYNIVDQIKREICSLKLIKHPNIVRLYEVLASKKKIYIVLEFVRGGELMDKILYNDKLEETEARKYFQQLIDALGYCHSRGVYHRDLKVLASKKKIYIVLEFVRGGELMDKILYNDKLEESEARKYFQQLIDAVGYCHSRGVYHRDLKPENVLLDAKGNVKISDFGLSALPEQLKADGLLHTTCGSPNYVAPEVISTRGYDGATADVWSCGVILFLLLTGWLPFDDGNLAVLYQKICKSEFKCPNWLSAGARRLLKRILDPNPKTRITIAEIVEDEWFNQGYSPAKFVEEDTCFNDVDVAFTKSEDHMLTEETGPTLMNAFELIAMSRSLDLSGLFEEEDFAERKTRFISMFPAKEIIRKIEETVEAMGFEVERKNSKLKLVHVDPKWKGRTGHLCVTTEVFEVTPCLHVVEIVEIRKSAGDIAQYRELCRKLSSDLSIQTDNVWSEKGIPGCGVVYEYKCDEKKI